MHDYNIIILLFGCTEILRQRGGFPKREKTIPTFSKVEIANPSKNEAMPIADTILILIYTGMRITELLTLTKSNVTSKEMLTIGGVKTETIENRTIPIHPKIQHLVRSRYNHAESYLIEEGVETGNKKKATHKIVRKKYNYKHYCDLYYAALGKLGIRRLTPHKARHTFFTMLHSHGGRAYRPLPSLKKRMSSRILTACAGW